MQACKRWPGKLSPGVAPVVWLVGQPAQEVGGEVAAVLALQVWALPVPAADRAAARRCSAPAFHRAVVVVEERVVGGQLLASADVAHGYQDGIAREAHVRLAGVIDEEHDRLLIGLPPGDKVKAVG